MAADPGLKIKDLSLGKLEAIFLVEKSANQYPWTRAIIKQGIAAGFNYIGAYINQKLVAYIVLDIKSVEAQILNLSVIPEFQSRGIGGQLLEYAIKFAKNNKSDSIFLEVRASNIKALRLYKAAGFTKSGFRKNYYPASGTKEDALVLNLKLTLS